HPTKAAHLLTCDVVMSMRFQSGIKDGGHRGLSLQPARNAQRTLVLLAYSQVQGLHSAQEHVSSHGVERGTRNLTKVIDLANEVRVAANDPSQCIGMPAEELGRTVKHQVRSERERVLVDGGCKRVDCNDNGAHSMTGC